MASTTFLEGLRGVVLRAVETVSRHRTGRKGPRVDWKVSSRRADGDGAVAELSLIYPIDFGRESAYWHKAAVVMSLKQALRSTLKGIDHTIRIKSAVQDTELLELGH